MAMSLHDALRVAVERGIISSEQAAALRELAEVDSASPGPEAGSGFNAVNIAYSLGALLVLFASAWFLVERWSALGPIGVLGVVGVYAAALVVIGRRLASAGFPRAGGMAWMLAVGMTPLVAWALMRLAGEWPPDTDEMARTFLRHDRVFVATRFLVLDLSTLLVALLLWRKRRFPALVVPLAVATWWTWFHLAQLSELGFGSTSYQRWIMIAAGLFLLAVADAVDRWQRSGDIRDREGDYAAPFWYVGTAATAFAYAVLWGNAGDWRHALPVVAGSALGLALLTGRRVLALAGIAGVFMYLAYLAGEVFKDGAMFPVVLAALGIMTIVATVWLQRRFKGIAGEWTGRWYGAEGGISPGRRLLPWVPAVAALVMAVNATGKAPEERAARERAAREAILRQHEEAQRRVRQRSSTADSGVSPR